MNTFNLTLDLNKSRASSTVRLRQGDAQGTTITALVLDHGATADLTGMTAQLVMELPYGTQYYRKTASISGNSVSVLVDETQAASVSGRTATAYFQMLQGTTVKASTGSFAVEILPDALAGATVPESYDSAIQDAIDALDDAVEQMPDMVEDVLAAHPEWTTTVQDGSITAPKLATDLALDRERLLYRLANMLTAQLPEGDVATASDAARTPMAALALYGRSTQDGTPTPSAPVPIVSVGAANLIVQPYDFTSKTVNGITWTANADGTVTANGTATNNSVVVLNNRATFGSHPKGTYTISGSPAVAGCYVRIQYATAAGGMAFVSSTAGNSTTFTTDTELAVATGNNNLYCWVPSGTTVNNVVFRPMLNAGSTACPYVPYGNAGLLARRTSDASVQTVTPIDLDGHELRSLPDGTRDEVTVDSRGHAVLVQRVGSVTLDGSKSWSFATSGGKTFGFTALPDASNLTSAQSISKLACSRFAPTMTQAGGTMYQSDANALFWTGNGYTPTNSAEAKAWAAANPFEVLYALATPQTIDLGYVAAVPLVGPDLTAQAVPVAPFALTYERDLNVTLARLESAIATLA